MANDDRDDEETSLPESDEAEDEDELEDGDEDDSDEDDSDESDSDESDSDDDSDAGDSDDDSDSDEGDSDDDDSDDDDSDDEDEKPAKRARAARPKGKGAKKELKQKSAAARLAAARAAKAARKAAKRGKELKDEKAPLDALSDTKMAQQAATFGDWAANNKPTVYAIVAVVVLVLAGGIGWYEYQKAQTTAAGTALAAAVEISNARIRGEDEVPDEDDPPSYTSVEARAEAALTAYDAVLRDHGSSDAAAWAHLGRGDMLLALDRATDARAAFEAAIAAGGSDSAVLWRALEGKGFTFEADEDWDHAIETYEELSRIDDGAFDPVAKYHIARMYIARDQTEEATEALSALVESLRDAENDETEQDFSYVLAQAEVRLRELDPSAVPARPTLGGGLGGNPLGGGAGGDSQISPEQLQEMIRRFQQQQAEGGGAGGEGGEGE
ncbi:MAG: hypothetical protein H6719_02290 [Sandaracinaceae bacterium]|nr:hypothetical protein [Sandaracinaceae bacterium]